ncbi:MAG TPA: NADH-quinone oxidoreductase subunit NuoF [Vicinamibacterales bacterium]|nr:NADH-quinone oxidoreductase subunit NuoF [Vicinamibacterales bacterium]
MSSALPTATIRPLTRPDLEALRGVLQPALALRHASASPEAGVSRDLLVCAGGGCVSCHSVPLAASLQRLIREAHLEQRARVIQVGCMGLCEAGPLVLVAPDGVYYPKVDEALAKRIVTEHVAEDRPVQDAELTWQGPDGETLRSREVPFFARQVKIALRNCGVIDPLRLEEYIGFGGYEALATVLLDMEPAQVMDVLKRSGLRGRGGAGFPAGLKWQFVQEAPGDEKYIVCNADEGDPGAFMDRSILEGDPHSIIEGMAIAGRVVGARCGYVYVRAEYPLAIERLEQALHAAREAGLLGQGILGSAFDFGIQIRIGAGAFVCGEETALIASIEGRRGMPRPRPPFPAQHGLWGRPTLINNVETWANIPPIILRGASWFAGIGTGRSKGTKVFALAGDVRNTGLVEVPMGISLREVVDSIGGGIRTGLPFKAVQAGGPSGGCVPAASADVPVDYESLQRLGAVMGSGGLIVLHEGTCMVELARFFLEFLVEESCGKCPPCRIGLRALLNLVERITKGVGAPEDLETIETLGRHVQASSLCGLGQTAPNAVLSTLQHFRHEYEAHIHERRCPAGQCKALLTYTVNEGLCNGCTLCVRACPSGAIAGQLRHVHHIDQDLCTHCGACLTACNEGAISAA